MLLQKGLIRDLHLLRFMEIRIRILIDHLSMGKTVRKKGSGSLFFMYAGNGKHDSMEN